MNSFFKVCLSVAGVFAIAVFVPRALEWFGVHYLHDAEDTAAPVSAKTPADGWAEFAHTGGCTYSYLNPPRSSEAGVYDYWSRKVCVQQQVDHIHSVEHSYFSRREKGKISCGIEEFSVGAIQYFDADGNDLGQVETGEIEDDLGNGVAVPGMARGKLVDEFCFGKAREWTQVLGGDDCTVSFLEPAMKLADGDFFLWKRLTCATVQNDGEIPNSNKPFQFKSKLLRNHLSCRSEREFTVYQEFRDAADRTVARWANVDPDPMSGGGRVYNIGDDDGELVDPDSAARKALVKYCKS